MATITLRLTEPEKQRIQDAAEAAGMTVSAYIRSLAGPDAETATSRLDRLETRIESAVAALDTRLEALEQRADAGY